MLLALDELLRLDRRKIDTPNLIAVKKLLTKQVSGGFRATNSDIGEFFWGRRTEAAKRTVAAPRY
ncbi:Uncharacterised protein [Mycobacteroides abscessus subsp. massiliense]|nr:Uncharacterised protein [Mycobacteroides abscessus subsp. massiliense]SKG91398.1 Uncharacterised protein [Mycobacteroides abscessus subsp. massiliense]SKI00425.1 Uncharacterised protein [Mycobacteroides abscessus subsp. massiliense]SKI96605.1 Uncharacterised protein [Mycobacteroides abscessus subsp. massiliense]SKJ12559.1 Uncharacterised protein [Mycobacteroides abscessus subsp. massiliense]